MKKVMIAASVFMMALTATAQTKNTNTTTTKQTTSTTGTNNTSGTTTSETGVNKNVYNASTITTTTVNDGSDPKKLVRVDNTQATNQIQIKDANSNTLNKKTADTPVQVTSSTAVMADSGFNQRIGQIHNYDMDGKQYMFISDANGFYIRTPENKDMGKIRKASNNAYIMKGKNSTSIGHFDASNNFVVETYNDKTDAVTTQTYTYKKQ